MSDLNYHGKSSYITRTIGELVSDRTKLDTCTAVFSIVPTRWKELPYIGSAHPTFSYIAMERRKLIFEDAFAVAYCEYAGIDAPSTDFTTPVYELCVGLSDEPIETHPKFVTDIGGTPKAPLNGATFRNIDTGVIARAGAVATTNAGYVFESFELMSSDDLNTFAKIESYLECAQITWRKTYNTKLNISDLNKVGKIDDPDGSPPALGAGRNWLNMGAQSTQRGSCFQVVQEWRASGRRGWNDKIYGTSS